MEKVLIAVPAYNCERQIVRVIRQLAAILPTLPGFRFHICVIENCSTDRTVDVCLAEMQDLGVAWDVFQNHENYGLGGSQKIAFRMAEEENYDYLILLHGDDQANVEDIPHLIAQIGDCDAVLGSRFSKGSKRENYSIVRFVGNSALCRLYSLLFLRTIEDLGSGLNLYRVSAFPSRDIHELAGGFVFNMDLTCYLVRQGIRFKFVPICWRVLDQFSNANDLLIGTQALLLGFFRRCGGSLRLIQQASPLATVRIGVLSGDILARSSPHQPS